jgi:hypothetical protein
MRLTDIEMGEDYAVSTWSKATWTLSLRRARAIEIIEVDPISAWTRKGRETRVLMEFEDGSTAKLKGIHVLCPWRNYQPFLNAELSNKAQAEALVADVAKTMKRLGIPGEVCIGTTSISIHMKIDEAKRLVADDKARDKIHE